ncbi:hypothetical protein chiPu_0013086 [Chiloscyllium punctatum]|uniref:Uncharacterized protein n=1 Tax=Chiloscyllium punctatum TaxID=137246 RepID=A0A401SW53_CHIPU|nr:hypothetical protein [Chiloscyllium punctatum]
MGYFFYLFADLATPLLDAEVELAVVLNRPHAARSCPPPPPASTRQGQHLSPQPLRCTRQLFQLASPNPSQAREPHIRGNEAAHPVRLTPDPTEQE